MPAALVAHHPLEWIGPIRRASELRNRNSLTGRRKMPIESFISADSHVVEPADLWTTRMDRRFRDRAPHIETREKGDFMVVDGVYSITVDLLGPMMNDKEKGAITQGTGRRLEDARPGGFDSVARILDQGRDHVEAEIIYPGVQRLAGRVLRRPAEASLGSRDAPDARASRMGNRRGRALREAGYARADDSRVEAQSVLPRARIRSVLGGVAGDRSSDRRTQRGRGRAFGVCPRYSAVPVSLRQEDVHDAAEPRAADLVGCAPAFSETAVRDRRRRHRMDRGATALHGSLVGGPPSLDATEARRIAQYLLQTPVLGDLRGRPPRRPDAPSSRRGPADVGFGLSPHRGHFPIFDPADQPGLRRCPRRRDTPDGA